MAHCRGPQGGWGSCQLPLAWSLSSWHHFMAPGGRYILRPR